MAYSSDHLEPRARRPESVRRLVKRGTDRFQDLVCLQQNVVVPETQHSEASRFQPSRALVIPLLRLSVLATVYLDHEVSLKAGEIGDIGTDRHLTSEAVTADLLCAQRSPET